MDPLGTIWDPRTILKADNNVTDDAISILPLEWQYRISYEKCNDVGFPYGILVFFTIYDYCGVAMYC